MQKAGHARGRTSGRKGCKAMRQRVRSSMSGSRIASCSNAWGIASAATARRPKSVAWQSATAARAPCAGRLTGDDGGCARVRTSDRTTRLASVARRCYS